MSRRAVILGSAALALAGCGFHLQGRTPLPESMKAPLLEAKDSQSEFVQDLRHALLVAGARVTEQSTDATSVVHVLQDSVTQRVLAVSPTNQPAEYELTYTVRFSVTANGFDLLTPQEVSATRTYSFNEQTLLAKTNEEAILREALSHDLVGVVMRRLSSL